MLIFSSEGLAKVQLNNKHGFIDKAGKLILPCIYNHDRRTDFSEGLALVNLDKNMVLLIRWES